MSIYQHRWNNCDYWRVYRAWNNQEYQKYIPIDPKEPAKSRRKAEEADAGLKSRQRAYYSRQVYTLEYHLDDNGKIRGLSRQKVVRKTDIKARDYFRLRVKIPWEDNPLYTSISIDKHGVEIAFKMAIQKYCDWYTLDTRSELREKLYSTLSYYIATLALVPTENVVPRSTDALMQGLQQEIDYFKKSNRKGVINDLDGAELSSLLCLCIVSKLTIS